MLKCCVENKNAAGKTFLVSDGEDVSTSDLIKYITTATGKPLKLFKLPTKILKFLGIITGKQKEVNQLLSSLEIDIKYTREELKWKPPASVTESIKQMVNER